jgi:hypothetical protein
MTCTYKLTTDEAILDTLKSRHHTAIATLENIDFTFFCVHQEIVWPFSALIWFPIYLSMVLGNEYVRIQSPLRITSFHLLFTSETYATYAYLYGMGCKFYTGFTDGTWLVTNTYLNTRDKQIIIQKPGRGIVTTQQIWEKHQAKIAALQAQGKQLNPQLSFDDWREVDRQFAQSNLPLAIITGIISLLVMLLIISELVMTIF